MNPIRIATLATVVAGAIVAPARAQLADPFVFTPYIGAYTPTAAVAKLSVARGGMPAGAYAKHKDAPAVGATESYWFADRLGVEAGLVYAGSDLQTGQAGSNRIDSRHANVWMGTAKLMLQVLPPESAYNLRFGFGPALIARNGSAFMSDAGGRWTGLTDIGAAMSLCTRIPVTSTLSLRLRAEDYLYQTKLGFQSVAGPAESFSFDAKMQNDFVFSAGLQLFVNR